MIFRKRREEREQDFYPADSDDWREGEYQRRGRLKNGQTCEQVGTKKRDPKNEKRPTYK